MSPCPGAGWKQVVGPEIELSKASRGWLHAISNPYELIGFCKRPR
jgi:hypothetical protein